MSLADLIHSIAPNANSPGQGSPNPLQDILSRLFGPHQAPAPQQAAPHSSLLDLLRSRGVPMGQTPFAHAPGMQPQAPTQGQGMPNQSYPLTRPPGF